jgi:hypothetical protein
MFVFPAAFSWFSLCEYLIASANMAFHVTVILDFPTEDLMVARGLHLPLTATAHMHLPHTPNKQLTTSKED